MQIRPERNLIKQAARACRVTAVGIIISTVMMGGFWGFESKREPVKAAPEPPAPVLKTVRYNQHRQSMTLCLPAEPSGHARRSFDKPFILLIFGSAWTTGFGHPRMFLPHCKYLARLGYPAATMDYRVSPRHAYPDAPNDVKDAIVWLNNQFSQDRVFLIGHSAGGHLALLVGLKEKHLPIDGIISLAGPTDLSSWLSCKICPFLKKGFLRGGATAKEASPIHYVRADAPPIYLFHGTRDPIVGLDQSRKMADALQKKGATVHLEILQGSGHWFAFPKRRLPGKSQMSVESFIDFILTRIKNL